jgi:hypothetical protein
VRDTTYAIDLVGFLKAVTHSVTYEDPPPVVSHALRDTTYATHVLGFSKAVTHSVKWTPFTGPKIALHSMQSSGVSAAPRDGSADARFQSSTTFQPIIVSPALLS